MRLWALLAFWIVLVPAASWTDVAAQNGKPSYDSRLDTAIKFYSDKKYEESVTILDQLTKEDPKRKEAFSWAGKAHYELKNWSAARTAYTRYAELEPKELEGPRGVARTNTKLKNLGEAAAWYKKALEISPGNEDLKKEADALAKDETPAATDSPGFWAQGLFGILGGRTVWWGWVIGIVIFVFGALASAAQIGGFYKKWGETANQEAAAPGVAFFGALVGFSFWYIVYWGLPGGIIGWCVMVPAVLLISGISAAAASQ